jgi:hypothetical protein
MKVFVNGSPIVTELFTEGAEDDSVEEIMSRAEKYYAGISSQWIAHDASLEDAIWQLSPRHRLAQMKG